MAIVKPRTYTDALSPNIPLRKTSPLIIKRFQFIDYNILSILILHLEVLNHWTAIGQLGNDTSALFIFANITRDISPLNDEDEKYSKHQLYEQITFYNENE